MDFKIPLRAIMRIMIYHSTLDFHVQYITLKRSLYGSDGQIKILTLFSDPRSNSNPNPNPNEKFDPSLYGHVT